MTALLPKVVLIGSGNVATHLGLTMMHHAHITGVYSATLSHCQQLAKLLHCTPYATPGQISADTDLVIIAVSDQQIEAVSNQLPATKALIVHTSGSTDLSALHLHERRGVWYPFQTFSKQKPVDFQKVPFLIETNQPQDSVWLTAFSQKISHIHYLVNSTQRRELHLAAVLANNFSNHLFAIAESLLNQAGLPFSLLESLLRETVEKACNTSPVTAQTGPAIRGDQNVINTHLQMLQEHPQWQKIYRTISESILQMYNVAPPEKSKNNI